MRSAQLRSQILLRLPPRPMLALGMLVATAQFVACDPTAKTDGAGSSALAGDAQSRAFETCSRSADCSGDLRCFDSMCQRTDLSVTGELLHAAGKRASEEGDLDTALTHYQAAVAQYQKEKLEVPPGLLCDHGSAILTSSRKEPKAPELAARVLHRCLIGAPAGSALHRRATTLLAGLLPEGLDPQRVARPEPVDLYLTRQPAAPTAEDLAVQLEVTSSSRSRSYKRIADYLNATAAIKQAVVGCAATFFGETRQDSLEVVVPFRYSFQLDQYDDFSHSYIKLSDAAAPSGEGVAAATTCVRAAIEPLLTAEGRAIGDEARWDAQVAFTVAAN